MNASVNEYQSTPLSLEGSRGARLGDLLAEDRVLVVQRLVAARAQDRLAQPLQSEHEQQRAHDESQHVDRQRGQGRTQQCDDHSQRQERHDDAVQRGAPAAGDAHGDHDRERLHHLDRARQEGGEEQEERARRHADRLVIRTVVNSYLSSDSASRMILSRVTSGVTGNVRRVGAVSPRRRCGVLACDQGLSGKDAGKVQCE